MDVKYDPQLDNQRLQNNGQWIADCPSCGKEQHFFMSAKTGLWDCKHCSSSGNWFKFVKDFKKGFTSRSEEVKKRKKKNLILNKLDLGLLEEDKNIFYKKIEKKYLEEDIYKNFVYKKQKTIKFLPTFSKIQKDSKAYKYILSRRYNASLIKTYNILDGYSGNYFNRIIIPVYLNKKLKGWLGRWIPINGVIMKRKYRNAYGVDFSCLLGNYDLIDNSKPVIICEGAFSSYRIGFNSVYSFGKKLSLSQMYLLKKKNVKDILLLFDSDAQKELIKVAEKLDDYGFKNVRIYPLAEGDPDDMDNSNNDLYERILDESFIYQPKSIVAMKRLK